MFDRQVHDIQVLLEGYHLLDLMVDNNFYKRQVIGSEIRDYVLSLRLKEKKIICEMFRKGHQVVYTFMIIVKSIS
jgi:hypothetical protein